MNKILSLVIISAALFFTSCKKQLDLSPTDSIDATKAFLSVADLDKGVLGVYSANNPVNKIFIASILADEAKISDENRGQGQFTFKYQFSAGGGEHNSDFGLYYVLIDRANRILEVIDGIPAVNANETTQKARIKAELLALRAVAHYELLIRFMPAGYDPNALGVAIMLKSNIGAAPARNKVSEVVAQIEADFAAARGDANIPDAPTDVLRISKAAIAAYQSRVAMLKRDWAGAITFATSAITLSGKSLASRASFPAYWGDANEVETIWKYRNVQGPRLLWQDSNGDVFFEPSDKLKNQFDRSNDVRFTTYFSGNSNDTSLINKYPGSGLGPQINDLKINRVAEMFLNRAEARAENNDLVGASSDINIIRGARIGGYVPVTFSTKEIAIAEILNERFKELCFEGFRFFDLKRKGLGVNRLASDVSSATWLSLPVGNYRFALPIPQDEIFANPNAKQNPNY